MEKEYENDMSFVERKLNAINNIVDSEIYEVGKKYKKIELDASKCNCVEKISNQIKCVKETLSISKRQLEEYDELKKDINPNEFKNVLDYLNLQSNMTKQLIVEAEGLVKKYYKVLKNLKRKKRRANNSWKKHPKYEERNCGDEPDCPPPSYAPPLPKYLPNGEKL